MKLPPVISLPMNIWIPLKVHVILSGGSTPVTIQTSSISVSTTTGSGWTVVTIGGTVNNRYTQLVVEIIDQEIISFNIN